MKNPVADGTFFLLTFRQIRMLSIQSDHSGCFLGVVDIKTKDAFEYKEHALK